MIRNFLTTLGLRFDPAGAAETPEQSTADKIILIIDDHPDSLQAMCLALADETCRIETADTATSATRKLFCFHPDLILVDWQVPATDGTRLARRLLADEELTPVPIVALTEQGAGNHGNPEFGGLFDGNIGKPIDARTLPSQVRAFLESSCPPPPAFAVDLPFPATYAADRREEAERLLDAIDAGLPDSQFATGTGSGLLRLAEVVEGSRRYELAKYLQQAERFSNASTARARSGFRSVIRLCRELVQREPDAVPGMADLRAGYLERRRASLGSLQHALKIGDFAGVREAGHNLKGTGAAYGFAEITEIGRALEAAAKDEDAISIEFLLEQIDSYISTVRPSPQHRADGAAEI
jgi:CheY-like chemotaxis protein